MDTIPGISDIDSAMLTGPVRRLLDSPAAEVRDWQYDRVSYIHTEEANLGLHRFRGTARAHGVERTWSIVLKIVDAPLNEVNPSYWNYHRREILAYEEGCLENLPGNVSAPRCLGINKYPGSICWLWLEDVQNPASPAWSLNEYGQVARHLGQFNGAYLTGHPIPHFPWLSRNWMQGWLNSYETTNRDVLERIQQKPFWEHPLLRAVFPRRITEDVLRLWARYDTLLGTIHQLPQTFCHLDAYRPNLFLRREEQGLDQTVAVDWVFTGIAAVGEEIANLLAASLIWLEHDAQQARDLDEAVFQGYLNGLRDAGWHGDARIVRLGFTAACALRWGVVGLWWFRSLGDPDKEAELEMHWHHPLRELALQWAGTETYLLDLAQEAFRLQQDLM
jgi:hypothetical protein